MRMDTLEAAQVSLLQWLADSGPGDPKTEMLAVGIGEADYKDLLKSCIDDGWIRVSSREVVSGSGYVGIHPSEWEITLSGKSVLAQLVAGASDTESSRQTITVNAHDSQVTVGHGNTQVERGGM